VNQLAGFAAVPHLGLAGVHAPAAQLALRFRNPCTTCLHRMRAAGMQCWIWLQVHLDLLHYTSVGRRQHSKIFHSEGRIPDKRADGYELLDEAHHVDLSDEALREGEPPLSRFGPPLHRHRHVYFKSVRAFTIAVPDVVVRNSYRIDLHSLRGRQSRGAGHICARASARIRDYFLRRCLHGSSAPTPTAHHSGPEVRLFGTI
jgi:hypothetical protein